MGKWNRSFGQAYKVYLKIPQMLFWKMYVSLNSSTKISAIFGQIRQIETNLFNFFTSIRFSNETLYNIMEQTTINNNSCLPTELIIAIFSVCKLLLSVSSPV